MSIRNLEKLFHPGSVAVIGASDREHSLGALVMRNLREGGFDGPIWPVNPKHSKVSGLAAWRDVDALPAVPDLAVVCTPAPTVPHIVAQLGAKGTRAAIVLSAGMRDAMNPSGITLQQAMLDAARPHLLRVLGPNCVGLLVPGMKLNASFAHASALPGKLAFVSQSGALTTAMLDWANARSIGFSHFVSLGDAADVDVADLLDYLGSDAGTRAILLYLESISGARKFMSAARAAARNKPVIVVKAGRAPQGAKAAASHTGALAGSDLVFDAAVRRAGMLRVDRLEDLFDAAETLARAKPLRGERLAILTNGGGAGVLAADEMALQGGTLAELSQATLTRLDRCLPATWSHGNPVDIIGDAPATRYIAALQALQEEPQADGVLLMQAPTAVVPSVDIAQACIPLIEASSQPVLTCWLGGQAVELARRACAQAGVPAYDSPERAVAAFMQLVDYRRNQDSLMHTPPSAPNGLPADAAAARQVIAGALAAGREWLDEAEVRRLLTAYGIPLAESRAVADTDEAVAAAQDVGFPVALKIRSPEITHKSDVGGVALELRSAAEVGEAARAMLERVRSLRPQARIDGFLVQRMVHRPQAHELIVGLSVDAVFGPVVLFGQGGTAVEVVGDRAVGLPPLNMALASEMVSRTRVARLLAGYRDRPAADREAVCASLLKISQMACDLAEVCEIDINPLLADAQGVVALDARIRVARPNAVALQRLAIRPYPSELEETVQLGGREITLRPIRPEDEPSLREFYAGADPRDMRLRFFMSRREVPHSELARYSQIDYDRDMTFVAFAEGAASTAGDTPRDPEGELLGEVRAVCDPDNGIAEFAIQLRSAWQGRGLGTLLLSKLIAYLRSRGTLQLVGECLLENSAMAMLAKKAGFEVLHRSDGSGTYALRMNL